MHHVRKSSGAGGGGDVDATRGAKSLTDAARSAAILSPMSAEEAQALSVAAGEAWRYVRLDDAKANLAPRPDAAVWFRLETVALGNATPAYPHGDNVAAVAAWKPPSPFRGLSAADCNQALDAIAAGPGEGLAYSAHRHGKAPGRWAGCVLVQRFALDEAEAARVLAAWLRGGVLQEGEYRDAAQRKMRLGVRVVDAKRPTPATTPSNTPPTATQGS